MNKIKIIKMIMCVVTISLFTYTNAEARDCSNPKGFHEKLMCKLSDKYNTDKTGSRTEEQKAKAIEEAEEEARDEKNKSIFKKRVKKLKEILKQKTFKDAVDASKEQ